MALAAPLPQTPPFPQNDPGVGPASAPSPFLSAPDAAAMTLQQAAARLRATQTAAFAGRSPQQAADSDAAFRPARRDRLERVVLPGTPAPQAPAAPMPAAPRLTEAELARAEGYSAGHAAGLAQGRAEGLDEGRAAGLAAGRAEGIAQGRAEAEAGALADLVATRDRFAALVRAMDGAAPGLADGLAATLAEAVRTLAAERAGQMIDALPSAFAARVAALADRVAQGMRAVSVHLHPDDLAAIAPHLAGSALERAALCPAPDLRRGDVEVRADGIRLSDLLDRGAA